MQKHLVHGISLVAGVTLVPTLALAHAPGAEVAGLVDGFRHPLLGWDHVLALLGAGAWAAQQRGLVRLALPATLLAALSLGGWLGATNGAALGLAELTISVSVLAFGALAGGRLRLATGASLAIAAIFGLAHGYAHGAELPATAGLVSFGAGMLATTALLQGIGWLVTRALGAALASGIAANALAQDATPPSRDVEEVEVTGRADTLVGVAESAAQGTVGAEQIELRPLLRIGEVLETVPGVIVTQHSGGGKANQYFLRGFNLDHGTDFATSVDGVPVNLPSHGHGQGWTDLNFVIPELVERVNYRKGVYYADVGDLSSAGTADLQLVDSLDGPLLGLEGGRFGHGRAVAAADAGVAGGNLLGSLEVAHDDGPWDHGDDFLKEVGLLRYSRGDDDQGFRVTALGYHGKWDATDQIAKSALPVVGRFGALDDSDGGNSQRYQLAAELHRSDGDSSTSALAYVFYYDLDLFSNFTYFATDPVRGDQFEQTDRRVTSGARITQEWLGGIAGHDLTSRVGVQVRNDDIRNGLYGTERRERVAKVDRFGAPLPATVRNDDIRQTTASAFVEEELQLAEKARAIGGVRADWFRFDVRDLRDLNSGVRDDAIVSPKLTFVLGPWRDTELYLQGGLGFHSNDARGVNTRVDPLSGAAVEPADPLVRTKGAEGGLRTTFLPGLHSTVSAWWLDIDSELVFVGDAGTTEAGRPSRRYGVELANYFVVNDWLSLDADLSFSHARFRDRAPEGGRIPGSIETVVAAGATVSDWHGLFGSLRLRYFGPRPLIEDDSVSSRSTLLLGAQLGYRFDQTWSVTLDAFNLLDRKDSDIDYLYESAISPTAPLREEVHFHPVEPISARLSLTAHF